MRRALRLMPRKTLSAPTFVADIEAAADWQVSLFLTGEQHHQRPTEQIKNVIEGIISADYHGRTVIELIQNAHDAHPKECRDGRIIVLLDETEGDHGVLYVANGGRPLAKANFDAMVNVAISSKTTERRNRQQGRRIQVRPSLLELS